MAVKIMVDPITRIEGHLKIEVEIESGAVVTAHSSGTLFRGLEKILIGRDPRDAQHITQRACGVCPIGHATASALTLDDAFGITPPPNGRIIRNLILGSNYIQSHILHFYHLAALDYVKGPDVPPFTPRYQGDYRLPPIVNQAAVDHYLKALEMRSKAQEMLAIFGAKMPHVTAIVPGGVTETVDAQKVINFRYRLKELVAFIENVYVPDVMAVAEVYNDWLEIGRGCENLLAYGVFPIDDEKDPAGQNLLLKRGRYVEGKDAPLDPARITEEVKHSWYADSDSGTHPAEGKTVATPGKSGAYSWLKSPRYDNKVHEVGPLARMWVNKEKSVRDLGKKAFSVMGRHAARALECLKVAKAMEQWLLQLVPGESVCNPHQVPNEARGTGLTEAPRGALGHWISIKNSVIERYQLVVPTTWNASPRDDRDQPGPIEQALVGTPVADPNNPIEVVRVVRSFDPCIACAVHLVTPANPVGQFRVC